jgi:N-acetylmuramoyl-L-alanine amidase
MDRRFFFKSSFLLSFLAHVAPGAGLLWGQAERKLTIGDGQRQRSLPMYLHNGIHYFNVNDFATFIDARTFINSERNKFVFNYRGHRVVTTADNPFVIINSVPYQMPLPAWSVGADLRVPISAFTALLDRYLPMRLIYDRRAQSLSVAITDVNITGIEIEKRSNGTLIHIFANREFYKKGITSDIRNGWLHVDIYGGKLDLSSIKQAPPSGIVAEINAFQFEQSCSIAFKLQKPLVYRDVRQDDQSLDLLLSLRTEEDLKESTNAEAQDELSEQRRKWFIDTIVIDPGHGGKDPGALAPDQKVNEKDVVLAIALQLRKLFKANLPGVKIVMTRDKDVFIPLRERTQIANRSKGKLFVSIHANSNRKRAIGGFETYILGESKGEKASEVALIENSVIDFEAQAEKKQYEGINFILATMAQNAFLKQSQYLAAIVQDELDARLSAYKVKNRGVKQGPFWVMVGASMPNVLVETAFISNRKEAKLLRKSSVQKQIASALYAGIHKYKEDIERAI